MTKENFITILNKCCNILTEEAKHNKFISSSQFENRVRKVLSELDTGIEIDFNPPPQAFPDIELGEYGVEVKFSENDTWKSIANSIQETQRIETVKYIYVIFGKMGGIPEVRWGEWEDSIVHVRTSHVPRFEIEIDTGIDGLKRKRESLFKQMGISYDDFRKLPMRDKMKYIKNYARKIHPDGKLWWIDDPEKPTHTLPIQARLYTKLSEAEKNQFSAEGALLCPEIVKSGRAKNKYDNLVLYLLTYRGVLCHQARDLFSAGSVANPKNDDAGGLYIERALKLLESKMKCIAPLMEDALFVEYWGESVPPEKRLKRWLEKADKIATNWKPSDSLFK